MAKGRTGVAPSPSAVRRRWFDIARTPWKQDLAIGLGAVAIALAMLSPLLMRAGGDPTRLFLVGDAFEVPPYVASRVDVHQRPDSDGYDSQFYLFASYDPLLLHRLGAASFDSPTIRLQRIGLPLLAWATALGRPAAIPWAYVVWQMLSVGVLAWALARLARRWGAAPGWALLAPLFLGALISWFRMMTDAPSLAALMVAIVFLERRRWAPHVALCVVAVLCRETTVLAVGGLGLWALATTRRPWPAVLYAIPLGVVVLWRSYVRWRLTEMGLSLEAPYGSALALPVVGIARKLVQVLGEDRAFLKKVAEAGLMASLLWTALAALWFGARRWRSPIGLALVPFALLALCMSAAAYEEDWGYGRTTAPLVFLSFALCLQAPRTRWLLAPPIAYNILYALFFYAAKLVKEGFV